nr:YetF domain-containing protein [uncultured Oscillibacter sp.]
MMTAFARTVILYFLIMTGLRLMGKRQIGELEPGELVLTMMISDLATVPMQDFGIPLLAGVIPILTLLALSMLLSQLSLTSLRFRRLACGAPSVLIREGVLQQETMRKNRYTLDELLEELRGQGLSGVEEVKYAVLENSGRLSVLPWAKNQPPSAEELGMRVEEDVTLPVILVNDGRLLRRNLEARGLDEAWLREALGREGLSSHREAFLLTVDERGKVACVRKEGRP